MVGSKCNLKKHVRNLVYPLPLQIGGPKITFFGRLCDSTATLTAYILGIKHDIDNRLSALTTTMVSYIVPKCHELWSTNGLKLDRHFYPPYVNSAFYVIARLRRRRSANRTHPNFAKRRTVSRANNLLYNSWGGPPGKNGAKKPLHLFGFSTTSTLHGEYLLKETWHRQSDKSAGKYVGSPYAVQKFHELWFTTGLQLDRTFTHPHYFVLSQFTAHPLIGINVVPDSDFKWNGIGFVCSSDSKPHKMLSCNCYRVGRPWVAIHHYNHHLL